MALVSGTRLCSLWSTRLWISSRAIVFLALIGVSACEREVVESPSIVLRVVRDESCRECEHLVFRNAYTRSDELFVEPAPAIALGRREIQEIEAIEYRHADGAAIWKAQISLTDRGRKLANGFRGDLPSTSLVLMQFGDTAVDVVMAGRITSRFSIGSFHSVDDLQDAFSNDAIPLGAPIVVLPRTGRSTVDELEAQEAEANREIQLLTERTDALLGDEREAATIPKQQLREGQ